MENKKKSSKKLWFIIGGGVLLTCLCITVIGLIFSPTGDVSQKSTEVSGVTVQESESPLSISEETNVPSSTNTPAPSKTPAPSATPLPTRTPTETPNPNLVRAGIYLVNDELKPGIYWGEGYCYWERLKDVSGDFESIIANGNSDGQYYVEVKGSDFAFKTDCDILPLESLPEPSGEFSAQIDPGVYLVGRDMQPGIYRGEGSCYWERLEEVSGGFESIIANGNSDGQYYVEVKGSDFAFKTDCDITTLESLPEPSGGFPEQIDPGTYLIGRDIQPGTYKGEGSCYWERLKDVSGEFQSIIANGNSDGQYYVQVKDSDFAFKTDCVMERTGD
jgi:hypothetical protein